MKKLIVVVFFIGLVCIVSTYGTKSIHGEQNQEYVEKILRDDISVKSKYGDVSNYKILKVGKFDGSESDNSYDYYTLKINGSKSSGTTYFKLYKDKSGKLKKHEIVIND